MKKLNLTLLLISLCLPVAWAQQPELLPLSFSGWQMDQLGAKSGSDPVAVDPTDFAVLKEYGFTDFKTAAYTRNGRKMQMKAARFGDATGAFGAFTFYAQPQMHREDIGERAVSNNTRVLFFRGNILVDVNLDQVTAMSAADLRALADALPRPRGNIAALPALPGNIPRQALTANTERYIVGPLALERVGVPIPASLIDFSKSPEVEFAKYESSEGEGSLTVIEYPTPQMAAERLRAFQAAALPGGPFVFKRTGPILAAVSGNIPQTEAQSLLASVNYDANVTWNQPTKLNPRDNAGNLILAIAVLIGIILLVAMFFGFAYGGVRVLAKRLFPNTALGRPDEAEFIHLDLK